MVITSETINLLRQARLKASNGLKYSDLTKDEKSAVADIHQALGILGEEGRGVLGAANYDVRLTSGFNANSGVRGYVPKDLWFAIYAKENLKPLAASPQLFMIISESGLEYGFAASTHPSGFSDISIKQKVREVAPTIYSLLPSSQSEAAESLSQKLIAEGGWHYQKKTRTDPAKSFSSLADWLNFLHTDKGAKEAGGSVSKYIPADQVGNYNLSAEVLRLTELFGSLMAQTRISNFDGSAVKSVWIEKTIVKGRQDREQGEHALGRALWSPQKSKSGGDIYANMRNVRPGDIVLHLTDNNGFTGISIADQAADDTFGGIAGTEWFGPCYRIKLRDYYELDPPLIREQFLKVDPYAAELKELIDSGAKGLFYNTKLELNQGAYLTKATDTLVSILNRAYLEAAGKPLPLIGMEEAPKLEVSTYAEPYSIEDALETLFLDKQEIEEILLLWNAKKNIILQGPPGVGKSFAAQKLAFALMGEAETNRVGFVQFHQSYSYEDFVEGFRPTEAGFELKAGKFVQFCRRAEGDPSNRYVFVIDEINRGNLSKILGELMLLIEGDKRGANWSIPLASGKVVFNVPANVYIIGLMNTADRSLAVVDYALRRRFAFIDLEPKIVSPKFAAHLAGNRIEDTVSAALIQRITALNEEIASDTVNLGPGFTIGHSFFCAKPLASETSTAWFMRIVRTEIAPLMREYWFDTPQRAQDWETRLLEGL